MLSVGGLSYYRNDNVLFKNLDFSVNAGETLHIVGGNGCGKTSLLYHLMGLLPPQQGQIFWQDTEISAHTSFLEEIAFVGHKQAIKSSLTVKENICLAGQLANAPDSVDYQVVLADLGLLSQQDLLCRYLSAGQKQRLALARLKIMPKLLWVLDEPFTALDAKGCRTLIALLKQQLQSGGLVILTSHQHFSLDSVPIKKLLLEER